MRDTLENPRIVLRSMLRNPDLRKQIVKAIREKESGTVVQRDDGTAIRINVLGPKAPVLETD